jgi:hypothetical protein
MTAEPLLYLDEQEQLQDQYERAVYAAMEQLFLAETAIYTSGTKGAAEGASVVPQVGAEAVETYLKGTALLVLISLLVSQNAHYTALGTPSEAPDVTAIAEAAVKEASQDIADLLSRPNEVADLDVLGSTVDKAVTVATRRAERAARRASDALARARLLTGTKTWRTRRDNKVRESHRALDGVTVNMDAPFFTSSGASLFFPGDTSAPIGEWINCRCWADYSFEDDV